ncbi:MAG TPA: SIS domain-containing protein [Steroidobacteraceae bacterium]|nr:SIS domain-containing protein [Steroidobacteraceae bacterium]
MWREIHEQPRAVADTLSQYIHCNRLDQVFIRRVSDWLGSSERIAIVASGSSRHAGLVGRTAIEALSGLPTQVEFASEYAPESARLSTDAAVMVISQSGETADTLAALRNANALGRTTLAVTNVPGSRLALEALVSTPTRAGIEEAIPATKSFMTQLVVLQLIALAVAAARGVLTPEDLDASLRSLASMPDILKAQLMQDTALIEASAARCLESSPVVFLGRASHYGLSCEGALKLKESAYVHAEAMPAGEFKHGPIAMLGGKGSLVILAAHDPADAESVQRHGMTLQLLEDLRMQGVDICAITNDGDTQVATRSSRCIFVPAVGERLLPLVTTIPLQLLAFHAAIRNGVEVDRPRHLVKSLTS